LIAATVIKPDPWRALAWITQTDARDAIRMYARAGLHPIAIHGITENGTCTCGQSDCGKSTGKHPVEGAWQSKPFDLRALDALLMGNWRFNIGLRMGMQPGGFRLLTVDVDGDRDLLAPLEEKFGPLPPTLTATSGKGLHLIYRLRDGAATPKNRVKLSEGVDIRSEGGQIVAAPSVHASGRRYRWIDTREPAVLP
jgi:putative DNA primase/helicase